MITVSFNTSSTAKGLTAISGSQSESGTVDQEVIAAYSAGTNNALVTVAFAHALLQGFVFVASQNMTLSTNGTNAVQTISVTGSPTGGTFTLTFGAQTTSALPFSAAAADVQSALQLLSSIGSGNLTCTGGPLPGTPIVCTFIGALAVAPQSTITHTDSFTGGSSPAASIASTTTGVVPSQTFNLKAGMAFTWGVSAGYFSNPITSDIVKMNATCATSATLYGRVLTP